MADKGLTPGNPDIAPIESRRAPVVDGEDSVLDVPDMGEFSAEAARPTPLDDIADAERIKLPRD